MKNARLMKGTIGIVAAIATVALSAGIVIADRPLLLMSAGQRMALSGAWLPAGEKVAAEVSEWHAEIDKADGRNFSGTICLRGGTDLRCGTVEGTASWGKISGEVTSRMGEFMGEFSGRLDRSGAGGSLAFADGEGGDWVWDWQGPQ